MKKDKVDVIMKWLDIGVEIYLKAYPDWRRGQTVFNVADDMVLDATEKIRATEDDCFFDDDKIKRFKDKLRSILDAKDDSYYEECSIDELVEFYGKKRAGLERKD